MNKSLMIKLLCSIICFMPLSSFGQIVNLYEWKWAIPREKTFCKTDIDVYDQFVAFERAIRKNTDQMDLRPQAIDYFFTLQQSGSKVNEFSVMVFLVCEKNNIGLRGFIYDHGKNVVIKEIENPQYLSTSSFDIAQVIINSISGYTFDNVIPPYSKASTNKLNACLRENYVNYLYQKHIQYRDNSEAEKPREISKPNVDYLIDEIEYYFKTENYSVLREIRKQLEAENPLKYTPRLEAIKKKYPKLLELIIAIAIYEDYRRYGLEQQLNLRPLITKTINELLRGDTPVTPQEEKILSSLPFKYDEIASRLGRALNYSINCQEVFQVKFEDPSKELSMFMEILSNSDISPMINSFEKNNLDCGNLKSEALSRSKQLIRENYDFYFKYVTIADSLFEKGKYEEARSLYEEIDLKTNGLSFYASKKISEPPPMAIRNNDARNILSTLKQSFIGPTTSRVVLDDIKIEIKEGVVTLVVEQNSDLINSWLSEVNYPSGSYKSRFQDEIELKIADAIAALYAEHESLIGTIRLEYLASSDKAGFKNNSKLNISDHQYMVLPNDEVCENTVYSFADTEIYHKGTKIPPQKQCFKFDDLVNVRAKRKEVYSYTANTPDGPTVMEENIQPKVNTNYSKNLALAYLRAKNRHDTILKLLNNRAPAALIQQNIVTEVAPHVGYTYRFVNLKMTVKLRGDK